MSARIIKISDDFWNIRGDFKIAGLVNIRTHSSLVRLSTGGFVLLDALMLPGKIMRKVDKVTDGGRDIEAIINLHPFHTVSVEAAHEQFPHARLYGTRRHVQKFPDLPWEPEHCETREFAALFADDLSFTVPEGVDFISSNDNVHFSSVIAYHRESRTLHCDDTLMYLKLAKPLRKIKRPRVDFHPTLSSALQRRLGAAGEFRAWAKELVHDCKVAENLCAAHTSALLGRDNKGPSIHERIQAALSRVEPKLERHEREYG